MRERTFRGGDSWPSPGSGISVAKDGKFCLYSCRFFMQVCVATFSQLRKQGKALFPPQQPAHSAGEGGLTSLPRAAGEPCGAAGPSAFARWPAGSVGAGGGGGGGLQPAIPAPSPASRALPQGRAAQCSWERTALVQGRLQPTAGLDQARDRVSNLLG